MRKAIILAGVSGTGKTHARFNDPALKDLPCVDIADVYREFPEFGWLDALHALLKRIRLLQQKHDAIVIEGYRRGRPRPGPRFRPTAVATV